MKSLIRAISAYLIIAAEKVIHNWVNVFFHYYDSCKENNEE